MKTFGRPMNQINETVLIAPMYTLKASLYSQGRRAEMTTVPIIARMDLFARRVDDGGWRGECRRHIIDLS